MVDLGAVDWDPVTGLIRGFGFVLHGDATEEATSSHITNMTSATRMTKTVGRDVRVTTVEMELRVPVNHLEAKDRQDAWYTGKEFCDQR